MMIMTPLLMKMTVVSKEENQFLLPILEDPLASAVPSLHVAFLLQTPQITYDRLAFRNWYNKFYLYVARQHHFGAECSRNE